MTLSPIAARHARMVRLMVPLNGIPLAEGAGHFVQVIDEELDELRAEILGIPEEGPADILCLIDAIIPDLEALHDDLEGRARAAVASTLVVLALSASAHATAAGTPLRDEGTLSDLTSFVMRALHQYGRKPSE